jgi:hypothetical protein
VISIKQVSDEKEGGESMPVEIKYVGDGDGIEMIGRGVVTGEEIYNANNVIYSGNTLLKQKYQLADFINVEEFDVSNEDIVKIANQEIKASETNPNRIMAIVGKQDLIFGLSRMWEVHVSINTLETMVFREREKALAWIKKKLDERK